MIAMRSRHRIGFGGGGGCGLLGVVVEAFWLMWCGVMLVSLV